MGLVVGSNIDWPNWKGSRKDADRLASIPDQGGGWLFHSPLMVDTRRSTGRMWSTLGSSSTRRNLECSRLQAQQCRRSSRADLTIFLPAPNKKSGGGCSIPSYPMVANLVPPPPPEASTARRVIFLSYFSRSTPWHGGNGPGSTTGDLSRQERADSRDTFRRVRSILDGPITRPHMWLVEAQHPELVTHGPEYFIGPFLPQP